MAQLSGHETLDYCLQMKRPVIKTIHVPMDQPTDAVVDSLGTVLSGLEAAGIVPLLDPEVATAPGGTGTAFDLAIARSLATNHRFLLAGGLTPENVAQAAKEVQPWGVDVSSGVESDGIKDAGRITAFIREVKALGVAR
jgi:phosphoribosylanthranilate isomerase